MHSLSHIKDFIRLKNLIRCFIYFNRNMLKKVFVKHFITTACFLFISSTLYMITLLILIHVFDRLIYLCDDIEKNPGPTKAFPSIVFQFVTGVYIAFLHIFKIQAPISYNSLQNIDICFYSKFLISETPSGDRNLQIPG